MDSCFLPNPSIITDPAKIASMVFIVSLVVLTFFIASPAGMAFKMIPRYPGEAQLRQDIGIDLPHPLT